MNSFVSWEWLRWGTPDSAEPYYRIVPRPKEDAQVGMSLVHLVTCP